MAIDLHLHSKASDGDYAPEAVVGFAHKAGVTVLSLTDHDTVKGNREAALAASQFGMRFIPGIELSCLWANTCIHVVGLGVALDNEELNRTCSEIARIRENRALEIERRLANLGIPETIAEIRTLYPEVKNISRAHFARVLLHRGIVKNEQVAFDKYLGTKAPAYVAVPWPELKEGVRLLLEAGAVPVLAHPLRYSFKNPLMTGELVRDFVTAGGKGIEVVSGSQHPIYSTDCEAWAKEFCLYASAGSDFHRITPERPMPGCEPELPRGIPSVLEIL